MFIIYVIYVCMREPYMFIIYVIYVYMDVYMDCGAFPWCISKALFYCHMS